MNHKHLFTYLILLGLGLGSACSLQEQDALPLHQLPPLQPDILGVTLPRNIAPLRFQLPDSCGLSDIQAVFYTSDQKQIVWHRSGEVAIAIDDWQRLIQGQDSILVKVQGKKAGQWVEYDAFPLYLSNDSIDPYLSYRLIEPGYEVWGKMGIYQRQLASYDESPILENTSTQGGCMNCHTYRQHDPDQMLFHLRAHCGGTYILNHGKVEKLNTKTAQTLSALVYPAWHPSGRYVAFSTNLTKQAFHSTDRNRIEVFDTNSDIVIYDVENHLIFSNPALKSEGAFETFPSFSPDGRMLYFCSADSVNVMQHYDSVHYSLCRVSFDADAPVGQQIGTQVDTLYNARLSGGSVSFPRVSPNGDFLIFTLSGYGNFSIWHKDADLYRLRLSDDSIVPLSLLNTPDVESFHSWSSNGRWLVFSSRREDGLYTRPFITHIDANGVATKPFPLPQSDLRHDARLMKSYNLPEFMKGPVSLPSNFADQAANDAGIDVKFQEE